MKPRFQFNNNGVCQNPESLQIHYDTEPFLLYVVITLASLPNGKWDYGYELKSFTAAISHRPTMQGARFKSKEEAIKAAIKHLTHLTLIFTNVNVGFPTLNKHLIKYTTTLPQTLFSDA